MIVLDASAAVCVLMDDPIERADALRQRLEGESIHVPHLIDLEVTQALRGFVSRGSVTSDRASEALADLREFPLTRHAHYPFLDRVWRLRANLTAYDAAYVTLASFLDAPLLTLDSRMSRAGTAATIEVF